MNLEFLRAHVRHLPASASALLLAATAAWAALGGDGGTAAARRESQDAAAALSSNPPPARGSAPGADAGRALAAWSAAAVAAPEGRGAWVVAPRPRIVPRPTGRAAAPKKEVPRPLPVATAPVAEAADPGRVRLHWEAPAAGPRLAPVAEIRVWRRGPADDAPRLAATLHPAARTWEDAGVEPRRTYQYSLQFADAAKREGAASPAASVELPADIEIRYTGSSAEAAQVVVRKFAAGEWSETPETVFPRDPGRGRAGDIGRVNRTSGRDSRTGMVLLDISRETFRYRVPVTVTSLNAQGQLVAAVVLQDREMERFRITVLEPGGARRRLWMEVRLPAGAVPAE